MSKAYRPGGTPVGTSFETFGDLRIQLDDGAYTANGTPEMLTMTNQALSGASTTWTASDPFFIRNAWNGTARKGFARASAGELLDADVVEGDFDEGYTIALAFTRISGTASIDFLENTSANVGRFEADQNDYSHTYGGSAVDASSSGPGTSYPSPHVVVTYVGQSATKVYQDAVDITDVATVWTTVPTDFEFSRTLGSADSNQDWEFACLVCYAGVLTIGNINALGQKLADDFGFTQTWAVT